VNKELQTGIRGLSIVCSDDGVWLCTKSDTGKSCMLNLSNIAKEKGNLFGSALFEWCEQTAKEAVDLMDKARIISDLESLQRILVALNADEVDDPEDYLMDLGGRGDLIETLEEAIKIVTRDVAKAAWNEQQTRIDELEAAFDMLHSHADDMIDIGGINILTISDVIMDKRGRAMRMRHTKIT